MLTQLSSAFGINTGLTLVIIIWSLVWKGFALWKAARRNDRWWFIALFVINLLGLLEMLYIFVITPWIDSREKKGETEI